jgi:hypothetical protein
MPAVNNTSKLDGQLAVRVLLTAVLLGLVADLLLRATPLGLNVPVLVLVLVLAAVSLGRWGGLRFEGEGRWLVVPMLAFSACLAWRDSATLNVANSVTLLCVACLAALTARAGQLRRAGLSQYAFGVAYMVGYAGVGLIPTLRGEIVWRRVPWRWWSDPLLAIGRGVLLAVPPLVVFGGLFVAADANFEHLVDRALAFDPRDWLLHAVLVVVYAWLLGGTLREMLLGPSRPRPDVASSRVRLGGLEIAVVLALLDVLFATFVVMQLPYLFGGLRQVEALGYSDYARRGFFELVWVAGLTLPVLLGAHWLVRREGRRVQLAYAALGGTLVLLLFVIMASAMQRMQLYVHDLGLTELRVQASAFMGWLAVVLVWFLATVTRGQRRHFAVGALASGMLVIGGLNVLDPDAFVVQTNARFGHLEAHVGRDQQWFDQRPLASLSPDAVPSIVAALPSLGPEARQQITRELRQRYATDGSSDWRSFNVSRAEAVQAAAALGDQAVRP